MSSPPTCVRCLAAYKDGRDDVCAGCMTPDEAVRHYTLLLGLALELGDWPLILSSACGIAVAAGRRLGMSSLDLGGTA